MELEQVPDLTELPDRFVEKIAIHPETGCWLWQGWTGRRGYGYYWYDGRHVSAHRYSYEILRGPLPPYTPQGLQLDHFKCDTPPCCNPYHTRLATPAENNRRSFPHRERGFAAENAKKTHCKRGHPYDEENTYITKDGWRMCRACAREKKRAARFRPC